MQGGGVNPMKIIPLVLGVSVAANAALVAVVMQRGPGGVTKGEAMRVEMASEARGGNGAAEGAATGGGGAVGAAGISRWEALNAGDHEEVVARLRAAGYPVAAIRAILGTRLQDEFEARQRALFEGVEESPYWRTGMRTVDPKTMAAFRELREEQVRRMKELLGPDGIEEHPFTRFQQKRMFGDIPADKAEALQRVMSDYGELRSQIFADANGLIMPEDREKIRYLESEMRSDVARILDPVELENYELRSSSIAHTMRAQLATFQPTEEEFRTLFHVAQAVDAEMGGLQGAMGQEETRKRIAAMNERAKQVLPPERYAAFEQAMDPRYGSLNRIAARYELPTEVVPQVYSVQQDIQRRAGELRTLPPAQRAAPMAALVQEANTRIAPLLGERGFEAYKVYGGQWMEALTRGAGGGNAGRMAPVAPVPGR